LCRLQPPNVTVIFERRLIVGRALGNAGKRGGPGRGKRRQLRGLRGKLKAVNSANRKSISQAALFVRLAACEVSAYSLYPRGRPL
ncbi:MAG: hypothetical protein RQ753_09855, partial [Desulfurivibrionaceae bacterium]|nr:hypothetical protein [Desulfurivibrionaceae bacterium]